MIQFNKGGINLSQQLTYETFDEEKVANLISAQPDFIGILKWAFQEYKEEEIVYACSFGAEGIVLIDLIHKVNKNAEIVFLDTNLHFQETYELIDQVRQRYPTLKINMIQPKLTLEEQATKFGRELWVHDPNQCCYIRKIVPLKEALDNAKAWITGLRREQSPTRSNTQYINKDERFKKVKICPLIHWTWDDVMTYIKINHLPYNPLHDKGYPSIGCAMCTKPITNLSDSRSGRWAGSSKTECGLHQT